MYWKAIPAVLLLINEGARSVSVYNTPAVNDQFINFVITTALPSDGVDGELPLQSPVVLADNWITFEFRGLGNALLLFKEDYPAQYYGEVFLVRIGGLVGNARISIHVSATTGASDEVAATTVNGITSESEFRWFWVSWDTSSKTVKVGSGNVQDQSMLLSKSNIHAFTFNVTSLAISTDMNNGGEWRFPSASDGTTTVISSSVETTTMSRSDIPSTFTTAVSLSTPVSIADSTLTELDHTSSLSHLISSVSTIALVSTPILQMNTTSISNSNSAETENSKGILDKPENVAAIATAAGVSGVGMVTVAVLWKKCNQVPLPAVGSAEAHDVNADIADTQEDASTHQP